MAVSRPSAGYWYPPGHYYPGGAFLAGIIIGSWLWGNCNWGGGLHVEHRRYNDFNRTNISDGNWRSARTP